MSRGKPTIIDIRPDGPHVVDPNATVMFVYSPDVLRALGAIPKELAPAPDTIKNPATPDPIYLAGVANGLGSFFDALVDQEIVPPSKAYELLWAAYENTKARIA